MPAVCIPDCIWGLTFPSGKVPGPVMWDSQLPTSSLVSSPPSQSVVTLQLSSVHMTTHSRSPELRQEPGSGWTWWEIVCMGVDDFSLGTQGRYSQVDQCLPSDHKSPGSIFRTTKIKHLHNTTMQTHRHTHTQTPNTHTQTHPTGYRY